MFGLAHGQVMAVHLVTGILDECHSESLDEVAELDQPPGPKVGAAAAVRRLVACFDELLQLVRQSACSPNYVLVVVDQGSHQLM
jgi:hypothetical protein